MKQTIKVKYIDGKLEKFDDAILKHEKRGVYITHKTKEAELQTWIPFTSIIYVKNY